MWRAAGGLPDKADEAVLRIGVMDVIADEVGVPAALDVAHVDAGRVAVDRGRAAEVVEGDLPPSWCIERFGNLVDPENTLSYGVLVPGNDVPVGVPFVRAQDLSLQFIPQGQTKQ